ncbi:MAG: exodeoxyribonuclease VII large subunit [Gammaproteobacteria bacterium]|nr:exodeoxyribonuclease VII large subunit [Gammaproteobacteria bacterium]
MPTDSTNAREIYSVSEINQQLKHAIASNFALLWVEGEISNLARPASGHLYFSIKDKNAQLRCVMFRNSNQRVPFEIINGVQVIIRAKASLYEARGDLQLIVDGMEEAGFGALQRQFEALKSKLSEEGLFDESQKKQIPAFPGEIAIVTSPSGAAIKDYLQVAQRRYPCCKKTIYSVPVQGEQAADKISNAIRAINTQASADIIVLIRGGGSIEDLWSFNSEVLARSISASDIPIVSGIGHEIDYTIADFVADLRAPTPSVAAELTCPETDVLFAMLTNSQRRLEKLSIELINTCAQSTDWLSQRLQRSHPSTVINAQKQSLKGLLDRLQRSTLTQTINNSYQLQSLTQRFLTQSPQKWLETKKSHVKTINSRLYETIRHLIDQKTHNLELQSTTMNAVSPLNTLQRGYSITVMNKQSSQLVTDHTQVNHGDQLTTYLASGEVVSRVESTSSKNIVEKISPSTKDTN